MFVIYFKRNYQSPLHQAELLQAQLLQSQLNPASRLTPEALNFEGIPDAADIEGSFEIDTSNQNGSPYFERYSESSNPLPTIEIRKALSDADFAFDEEYYSTDDDEIEVSNEEAREAAQELIDLGNQIEVGSEVDSDPFGEISDPYSFNAFDHFCAHFRNGFFCEEVEHEKIFQKHHEEMFRSGQSHSNHCINLRQFAIERNPYREQNEIPNYLGKRHLQRGKEIFTASNLPRQTSSNHSLMVDHLSERQLRTIYEGTYHLSRIQSNQGFGVTDRSFERAESVAEPLSDDEYCIDSTRTKPPTLCMLNHELEVSAEQTPTITVDIDSMCGEFKSLAAIKTGWIYYPYTNAPLTGRTHGVYIKIPYNLPFDSDDHYLAIADLNPFRFDAEHALLLSPEKIPHIFFGKLHDWSSINIYLLFPNIFFHRRKGLKKSQEKHISIYLSDDQRKILHEEVIHPAMSFAFDHHTSESIPSHWETMKAHANAHGTEQNRLRGSQSRFQSLGYRINPNQSDQFDTFTRECYRLIEALELVDFYGLRLYFNGKGFKDSERQPSFSQLHETWGARWSKQFNNAFIPMDRCWLDLGRQFTPVKNSNFDELTMLWKPCCIKKYYDERATKCKTRSTLPLEIFNLGGCRDIISATMTARKGSKQAVGGACYSQFYTRSKMHFVTSTVEVFQSRDIDALAYGSAQLKAVGSAGKSKMPTFQNAADAYINGVNRTDLGIDEIEKTSCEPREEHRIRVDICFSLLRELADQEKSEWGSENSQGSVSGMGGENFANDLTFNSESLARSANSSEGGGSQNGIRDWEINFLAPSDARYSSSIPLRAKETMYEAKLRSEYFRVQRGNFPNQHSIARHLPFWIVQSPIFASFLRSNVNKALMGFEHVLSTLNHEVVKQSATATALMFLELIRNSVLCKNIKGAPHLYQNHWNRRESNQIINRREGLALNQQFYGMGMERQMMKFGYAYFCPKVDFRAFRILDSFSKGFFPERPDFVKALAKKRLHAFKVWEVDSIIDQIQEWFESISPSDSLAWRQHQAILEFCTGLMMIAYRCDVWAQLDSNKTLKHHSHSILEKLISGQVSITFDNITQYVRDLPECPSSPDLHTSNAIFHKGNFLHVLDYLFGINDDWVEPSGKVRKRDHWKNKPFRIAYRRVFRLIGERLGREAQSDWQYQFYCVVHATNPLLPNPDTTQLLSRKKNNKGYSWLAWNWIEDFPPAACKSGPISVQVLMQQTSYHRGPKVTHCNPTKNNSNSHFRGVPPKLTFETEFLPYPLTDMDRIMKTKWVAKLDRP